MQDNLLQFAMAARDDIMVSISAYDGEDLQDHVEFPASEVLEKGMDYLLNTNYESYFFKSINPTGFIGEEGPLSTRLQMTIKALKL